MEDNQNPSIDSILENIKREARYLESQGALQVSDKPEKVALDFSAWANQEKSFPVKRHYYIYEFLMYDDAEFVSNAYLGLLQREPDEVGFDACVSSLRQGGSKEQILLNLLNSDEGRAAGIEVEGMHALTNEIPIKSSYHKSEFLVYDGSEFVHNAYRGILQRSADEAGFKENLHYLESGGFKSIVLVNLTRSAEAKEKGTSIEGLAGYKLLRLAFLVPVLGVVAQAVYRKVNNAWRSLVNGRIDALQHRHHDLWSLTNKAFTSQRAWINDLAIEDFQRKERSAQLVSGLQDQYSELQQALADVKADNQALRSSLSEAQALQVAHHRDMQLTRNDLLYQQANVQQLLEQLAKGASPQAPQPAGNDVAGQDIANLATAHSNDRLDAYYVAFEEECRGSTEEIQEAQSVYLPLLERAATVSANTPLLDVGCGRGEWLDLLSSKGFACQGVDSNSVMVERCKAIELTAVKDDALVYLRAQADASLGAVSGFHIIEHLPFDVLFELFAEALRALVPGGLIIFETPNPENLLVASHTFYHDPTHRNPITPTGIEFLARYAGFGDTEIVRLHPYPAEARVKGMDPLTERVNGHLCGPQDFAIVARKPA